MINVNNSGVGYFKGDNCKTDFKVIDDNLLEFVFVEGINKGNKFVQPRESVVIISA